MGSQEQLGSLQARDLVQEVWLALVKDDFAQLRSWDPARGASLQGYVCMVVDREVSNHRAQARASKRAGQQRCTEQVEELADAAVSPEGRAVDRSVALGLWEHLAESLPRSGQEVLVHLCVEHRTPEEAAGSLGVHRQVIYHWRHEIKRRAQKYISGPNAGASLRTSRLGP